MDDPPRRRLERKSGSSSRSPSLSRRPSLKDKKAPGTIAKVKGKKSSASGSKKERWLLTRKTWRYMSETVGNLLPERQSAAPGTSTRRPSGPVEVVAAGPSSSAALFTSHSTDIPAGPSRPKSMPSTIPAAGSAPGSKASSTVTSPTYGGIMSFPSHRPGVTPTGPGPGNMPRQQGLGPHQMLVATEKFYPPSDDIPTLEKHFDAVCSKEKRFLLWTRSKPKGLSGPTLRDQKPKKDPKKSSRRDSSGSIFDALRLQLGTGKENVGEYYSPTTEEEDDYDEYDDPEEVTLRERRKSSTASSTMSILSTGKSWNQGQLTFFRPVTTPSHGSESSYSMVLTQQGITICRNTGTQTDPFPEELLIRFRLQAVQEERKQQCLRQVSPDNQSDTTTVESPLSPVRLEAQKVSSPPPTTTASSPMSPTTSTEGGRESQEKLLETGSSTRPSISGQSESMATTKSGDTNTTATTTTTDKKSEESGYSSSISDTVMRYLRMVRKNSKADNKDTIDKFKTVNYDRSLRNIKSKNVTVEEALEHERNKEKAQQARIEAIHLEQQQQKMLLQAQKLGLPLPVEPPKPTGGEVGVSKIEIPPAESSEPPAKAAGKKKKKKDAQAQPQTSPTVPTAPVSPLAIAPSEGEKEDEKQKQTEAEFVIDDSDIPPSSPPPPPPISPTSKDSPALSSPSSPTLQQEQEGALAKSVRCPLSSVGIQAGESLVRFLRNLNPNPLARKMSDFSSSCCSSESPGEVFSPRYSFATTVMSGSASDTEMFGSALQQAAMASMMAMSHTKSIRRQDAVHPQTPTAVVDSEAGSEFDDVFQGLKTGFFQKSQQQQHQSGPLSSSWTGSASTSSTCTTAIKKSSSVQQMVSFEGEVGAAAMAAPPAVTTASSSSSYSLSQLFHYPSKSMRNRDVSGGGATGPSPAATSTPGTPTTSSMGGSSGGLMKSFFGSTPFSSTFGLKLGGQGSLRKPTSTTSLTITTNTGSDSVSGRGGNAPPPTTSSSPNLLSLIQSSAASAGSGFTSFFSSRSGGGGGGGGGNGSSVTSTSASRGGGDSQQVRVSSSSAASSSGELRAQETGAPLYSPLYPRSSLPTSGASGGGRGVTGLGLGTHLHHRHPSTTQHRHHYHVPFTSTGASGVTGTAGGGGFMAKGLSDLLFSHGHRHGHASGSGKSSPAALSHVDLYLSPSGVMQKSKSSSSVLPLYGSSGSVSGAPGASSSGAAHLRVSPSGSLGGGEAADGGGGGGTSPAPGETAATATNQPTSSGSRLISKSKFFKARSKSSTRVATSSSGSAICSWSPQGRCKWKSVTGKVVTLEGTNVLSLSEVERLTLQDVALEKLRALNLGVEVKIPKEKVGGGQQKPKRRPYLIKKKALSTGFFESASKREDTKETTGGGSGLVFGISLSQCVANDRLRQMKATADWELSHHQQQHQQAHHKRSQNGSRNSVSSVFELPKEDKVPDPLQPAQASSVPGIVSACITHLENYGLHTTGIFRVSTSLKRIRQLREDIDSGKEIQFGEDHSPHDVAALLKEFLRDLPEPLLCRDLYQAFLKTQKIRNRKLQLEAIQHLVQLLPVSNRDTLAVLLKFFSKVVANACETRSKTGELLPGNKMEGYSLATLIAPNILPCMPTEGAAVTASASSMDQNAALTKERRESIDLVNYMISNYTCIFEMTPELLHDVYLHLMDTNPEAIEGILRQRCGASDDGVDELETTSSVFEESEGGETLDPDDTITGSTRLYRRREEILHEGAGKGGVSDDARTRERHRGRRDDGGGAGAGSSMGMTSEMERQAQSGGESDSSVGTRSTSRWFRRSRGSDAKGRTSSDSGSEKVKGRKRESSLYETKRASSLDSVNIQEPVVVTAVSSPGHAPRVSPRASAVMAGGTQDLMPNRPLSGSDQSLRVPEHLVAARRQSSPVLESSGIITASLKIPVPVPLNIDDTDIPYIEDENNAEATTPPHHLLHHFQHLGYPHHQQQLQQILHQGYLQYPQQPQHPASSSTQQKYPQSQYHPYHPHLQPQHPDLMASDVTVVRCRSMSTDSSVPLKTTSSSMNTTPISSPARQPSSEVSSPTGFSPPTSPPLYGTFPIEEMTARMLIGSAAASSSTPSTVTALSTSPSLHQFPGAITMITPSSTGTVHQYSSIPSTQTKDPILESKSAGSTPVTRPKIEKPGTSTSTVVCSSTSTGRSAVLGTSSPHLSQKPMSSSGQGAIASLAVATPKIGDKGTKSGTPSPQPPAVAPTTFSSSQSVPSVTPVSSSSSSTQQQPGISSSAVLVSSNEPKGLGKETKGANIGGLMKSKTADFDRLSTTKSSSSSIDSTEPITTSAGQPSPSSSTTSSAADSTTPVVSSSSQHQIYSIAPKMRLRSQENVLLKQQFLLRQQQQHQQGESSTARRERVSQKGRDADDSPPSSSMSSSVSLSSTTTATPAADHPLVSSTPIVTTEEICSQQPSTSGGGRAIIRRRLVGSQSTSAIGSTKLPLGGGASSTSIASPRVRTRESEAGAAGTSAQAQAPAGATGASAAAASGQSASTSATPTTTAVSTGSSPSRWKRSEIIASRQQSQPSSDPETFV